MQDVAPESTAQARAKRILSATPLFERLSKPSWNKAAAAVPGWVQRNRGETVSPGTRTRRHCSCTAPDGVKREC